MLASSSLPPSTNLLLKLCASSLTRLACIDRHRTSGRLLASIMRCYCSWKLLKLILCIECEQRLNDVGLVSYMPIGQDSLPEARLNTFQVPVSRTR